MDLQASEDSVQRPDDQEFAERRALELGTEDWFGIWELHGVLNTARPELPEEDRAALAANALRRLNALGYVTLIRVPQPGPSGEEEYASLPIEDVEVELEGDGWRQNPPASDVWFATTPEGEAALEETNGHPTGDIPEH